MGTHAVVCGKWTFKRDAEISVGDATGQISSTLFHPCMGVHSQGERGMLHCLEWGEGHARGSHSLWQHREVENGVHQ